MAALKDMPEQILLPALQHELPASVLDWAAELRPQAQVHQAILLNNGTDDLTVAAIAQDASANLCEVISNNQVRILRSPVILENLYKNPNARMATVDRLIDLASRHNVRLEGLPALQDALDSNQDIGLALEPSVAEESDFAALLQQEQAKARVEEEEQARTEQEESTLTRRELELKREKEQAEEDENKPLYARIGHMKIAQKIRMATIGSREAVGLLVRESNRLVHMAAIQNPRLQYSDIKKLAANKAVPDGVIRYIANNREWTKHYDVMLSLVNNPKTPMADTISFLNHLRTNDLRMVMKNRNVSHQISRQAKTIVTKRSSGHRK